MPLLGNTTELCENEDLCVIRFYERQYFNGAYWTLDSTGVWKNSRPTSRVKFPYHNFHVKSIRSFCSITCSWQICPANRRRKYSRMSRKKHCKILHSLTLQIILIIGFYFKIHELAVAILFYFFFSSFN